MKQIPTPQLIRIPDPALAPITSLTSEAIDLPNQSHETIWEEFLRLQLKPRTRQEYGKSIYYFCRSMAPDRSRSVPRGESPSIFLQKFLASTKQQAIHLVLAWRQRLLNEGKASATINLRISALKSLVEYAGKQDACSFSLSNIKSLKSQSYKDTHGFSVAPMFPPFSRTTLMPLKSRFHWVTLGTVRSAHSRHKNLSMLIR
jgi:integrase/recombinase XerC